MIDESRIIKTLENRIDEFVKKYPKEKSCISVQTIQEFIHMLELEAIKQKSENA